MKRVEKLIPYAMDAIDMHLKIKEGDIKGDENSSGTEIKIGQVNEAYNGYIASYAAAIIQSGLLAATAMFSDEKKADRTKGDKPFLMKTIYEVIKKTKEPAPAESRFFDYVHKAVTSGNSYLLKREILDASIAIKLALRTFELVKPKSK